MIGRRPGGADCRFGAGRGDCDAAFGATGAAGRIAPGAPPLWAFACSKASCGIASAISIWCWTMRAIRPGVACSALACLAPKPRPTPSKRFIEASTPRHGNNWRRSSRPRQTTHRPNLSRVEPRGDRERAMPRAATSSSNSPAIPMRPCAASPASRWCSATWRRIASPTIWPVLEQLQKSFPDDADVLYETAQVHMKAWNDAVFQMYQKTPASFRVNQLSGEIFEIQGHYRGGRGGVSQGDPEEPRGAESALPPGPRAAAGVARAGQPARSAQGVRSRTGA